MSAAPPSRTTPRTPLAEPDDDPAPTVVTPQRPPAVSGWLDALATASLVTGIAAALITLVTPSRDPLATGGLALLALVGLVLGAIVRIRAERAAERAPSAFLGIILSVVALALLAISFVPYLFMSVLSERPEPEPAPPAAVEQLDEQRRLEASARLAMQTLDATQRSTGAYPAALALTTDGDRLLTPDGFVVTELPPGTEVSYEASVDGTRYDLVLFGVLGGRVAVDSEQGIVSSTPGAVD